MARALKTIGILFLVFAWSLAFADPLDPCRIGYTVMQTRDGAWHADAPREAARRDVIDVIDAFREDAQRSSRRTKAELRAQKVVKVNRLIVGRGVHGATLAANLALQNPRESMLVIDADDAHAGVFNVGRSFRINSPGNTSNEFPGLAVRVRDLTPERYSPAEQIDQRLVAALKASKTRFLLGQASFGVEKEPEGVTPRWPAKYRLRTEDGYYVYADAIYLGTGFGPARIPLADKASRAIITRERNRIAPDDPRPRAPGIQTTEDVMTRARYHAEAGISPLEAYRGDVIVVGGGHGGMIDAELFARLAPAEIYATSETRPKSITWLDVPERTGDELKARVRRDFDAPKWDRYDPLAAKIDDRTITTSEGLMQTIRRVRSGPHRGKWAVTSRRADGTEQIHYGDHVVLAMGQKSELESALGTFGGKSRSLEPITGDVEGVGPTRIGRQVFVDGTPERVYVFGTAALPLATPEEVAKSLTHNPVSIDVLAGRTQALASATSAPYVPIAGKRIESGGTTDLAFASLVPKAPSRDAIASGLEARTLLQRALSPFRSPGDITLEWRRDEMGALGVRVIGASPDSAANLAKAILADKKLVSAILDLAAAEKDGVRLHVPFRETGELWPDRMNLEWIVTP